MRRARLFFFTGLFLSLAIFMPVFVFAGDNYGLDATAGAAGLNKFGAGPNGVQTIAGNIIGAGLSMIGVLFFILMLYGGILWMTARGNSDQTEKALHTIVAASVGMVIVVASYALTNFVFESVTSGTAGGNNANRIPNNAPTGECRGRLPQNNVLCGNYLSQAVCEAPDSIATCVWSGTPTIPSTALVGCCITCSGTARNECTAQPNISRQICESGCAGGLQCTYTEVARTSDCR